MAQVRDHHRGLGLAVVLREDRPEPLERLGQPHRVHRRGAVVHGLQRGQVAGVGIRVVHQRVDHRRHQHGRGDAAAPRSPAAPRPGRTWAAPTISPPLTIVGTKNAAPACDSGVHIRKRGFSGHSHSASWIGGHRGDRPHGAHHALGLAGGAAGVGQPADVVRRQLGGDQQATGVLGGLGGQVGRRRASSGQAVPGRWSGPAAATGTFSSSPSGPLDERRRWIDDQRRHPGVGQHVGVVVQRPERV